MEKPPALIVANHAAFNRRGLSLAPDDLSMIAWDEGGIDLSETALCWAGEESLTVLPGPPAPGFVEAVRSGLGIERWQVAWPTPATGVGVSPRVEEAMMGDDRLMERVKAHLLAQPGGALAGWGSTEGLYALADRLRGDGCELRTPELADPSCYGTAFWLDSKAGIRCWLERLSSLHSEIRMAEGFCLPDLETVGEALAYFRQQGCGAVVKSNLGAAGFTVLRYPAHRLGDDLVGVQREVSIRTRLDPYWSVGPFIVEAHVEGARGAPPLPVSVVGKVCPGKEVQLAGVSRLRFRRGNVYVGAVCGKGALDDNIERQATGIATILGEALGDEGCRGWFDVDFVVDGGGSLWVTECNLRRSAPLHAMDWACRLWGTRWPERGAVVCDDHCSVAGASRRDFATLGRAMGQFRQETGLAAMVTLATHSLNRRVPYFGFMVAASDAVNALEASHQLATRVRHALGCPPPGPGCRQSVSRP